jgi:hypothetical protein
MTFRRTNTNTKSSSCLNCCRRRCCGSWRSFPSIHSTTGWCVPTSFGYRSERTIFLLLAQRLEGARLKPKILDCLQT